MGSSRGNCEIIEAKDALCTTRKPQTFRQVRAKDQEQKPPILKKGHAKFMENDINKLFEAVNLRNSKSLDFSDSWRNASKRPMRSPGSLSPVIGFSEPVTLKQALRGLCISQAAEVAAMKRLSMTASPRVSEAGKNMNLYSPTIVKVGGSAAQGGVRGMEITVSMEASTSYSSGTLTGAHQDSFKNTIKPNVKSTQCIPSELGSQPVESSGFGVGISLLEEENISTQKHAQKPNKASHNESVLSSPHNPAALISNAMGSSSVCDDACSSEVNQQLLVHLEEEKHNFGSALPLPRRNSHDNALNPDNKLSGLNKVTTGVIEYPPSSLKVVNKAAPRSRRKSKLQAVPSSTAVNSNKDKKSTRSTSRTGKPVLRSKNLIIKKSKKVAASTDGNLKISNEVNNGLDHISEKLICQRCKCSLRDTDQDSSGDLPATTEAGASFTRSGNAVANKSDKIPSGLENRVTHVTKTNTTMKSTEKGDISQSSSSIFGFSSSSTSLSDESVSGSACGNRPHMSKDMRWGAINRIRKQNGFLGLNHFNLLKKLGSGDIGTVYLAELIGTNCPFAIKVMDNEFLARRKKIPRAQTEGEILRMLDHPFLPTLYARFTSDNLSCLVMEYCPGGDLHVLRQKQPGRYFHEQAARFYVAEVLLALEYLHMLGIVYRDLKPENILVREDGHIMLTDFDLSLRCSVNPTLVKSSIEPPRMSGPCAGSNCIDPFCNGPSCKVSCFTPRIFPRKLKSDNAAQARSLPQLVAEPTEARSNSFVGTHEYLAPEIIKGEGHGSAVDWWTFGVLLYELIYGKTPFKGGGNEETLANAVLQNLKFPDSPMVSFHSRDLIRGLLVKEPENRLGTETGAAEIKRHPFFDGLNWALIRCAVPPELPELYDAGSSRIVSQEKEKKFVKYTGNGEHLVEFELF